MYVIRSRWEVNDHAQISLDEHDSDCSGPFMLAVTNLEPLNINFVGNLIYFSFVTLTTTGYGDIVPLHPYARSLANIEAVIGQLYPATLLAKPA